MRSFLALIPVIVLLTGCAKGDSDFENERERVNAVLRDVAPAPQRRVELPPPVTVLADPIHTEEVVNIVP